ncbi:Iron-sulfur cluster biosynthesis family protein [Rhynchospora pubera]|uniref:Iron-sulfur cluster biosynthesis family protein n=1 Tax=Rhynchospora pubera TaxID=906938 RepID=A0AAV8CBW6_9POAL|nr:Iron-sulfur cluster biosynthesis family protein [Rhynchospora pubera]KAJ4793694.1 Iron-sulfur cluster biosynthesis family protein [Rhynchospora pubera]
MASISQSLIAPSRTHHHLLLHRSLPFSKSSPLPGLNCASHLTSSLPLALRHAKSRALVPAVRASIEVPAAIRPGGTVETDRLPSDVRDRSIQAVDSLGGRVTVGDVAAQAGLKLDEAERALQALAADTGGFLEVSDEGDVLYTFPKDYRAKLAAKSFKLKVEPLVEKAKGAFAYLIRVSFGTALIASIVLVYTTIIALASSQSDEDNRKRRSSFNSGVTVFFNPTDLFWYWDVNYYKRRHIESEGELNFIESVFSFVFGDGDPNQGLEEERWKLIGQYISSNGGVVTAEELAPFLDVPPLDSNKEQDEESYILPVLLRFQGHPEVDEQGNILYLFPSLQRTASSRRIGRKEYVGTRLAQSIIGIDRYFKEQKWKFSKSNASQRALVVGLGALNLFGVIILGVMLKDVTTLPRGLISLVSQLLPLLQAYAASFFAIPCFRWLQLLRTNNEITKRNEARLERARALELPNPSLRRKLLSARDMASQKVIRPEEIVYTTRNDIMDQDYEEKEWDRRFKELE